MASRTAGPYSQRHPPLELGFQRLFRPTNRWAVDHVLEVSYTCALFSYYIEQYSDVTLGLGLPLP